MTTSQPPNLRQRLLTPGAAIGPIMPFDTPALIELCGLAGFDFIFLDTEHGALQHTSYEDLLRAADLHRMPTIVRVGRDQPLEIARALDAGAQGVHSPVVETAEQARASAAAARFFPAGQRGLGPVRAGRYGIEATADYVKRANEQTLVVAAIESPAGVDDIAAIGATPGVDVLFIAPADLSAMLGRAGQFGHPEVAALIDRALDAALATGKPVGSLAFSAEHAQQLAARGVQYILMVLTSLLVRSAQDWLSAARQR
jgi:4-hydroxy-2-oxoheptanedioate aldolase